MASLPRFEPGPHWWEASALTTAPSLAPLLATLGTARGAGEVQKNTRARQNRIKQVERT